MLGAADLHDETHVHETSYEDLRVSEGREYVVEGDLALMGILAEVCLEPGSDVSSLLLVQPLRIFGTAGLVVRYMNHFFILGASGASEHLQSREDEEKADANDKGESALDYKDPSPSTVAS